MLPEKLFLCIFCTVLSHNANEIFWNIAGISFVLVIKNILNETYVSLMLPYFYRPVFAKLKTKSPLILPGWNFDEDLKDISMALSQPSQVWNT